MANELKLENPLSSDRKPVKVGDDSTGILLEDNKVIVENDIEIGGEATVKDLTVDGNLIIDHATGSKVGIGVTDPDVALEIRSATVRFKLSQDATNYFMIQAAADGVTSIATVDSDGAAGHLTIAPDGDLILDPVSTKTIINATDTLFFDGGVDTYIYEQSADTLRIVVGGDNLLHMAELGDDGNYIAVGAAIGFERREAAFSATEVIGSAGTDDTDIDFRQCNKVRLEMTGDITTMNLIFPLISGNFLLVCTTDGDHDVANWKVFRFAELAASTTDVMWAGGSVPAFTNSGIDIVSFYWDATEQQAYGTASLAFATP